jgi:putative Holliday junction resolvase
LARVVELVVELEITEVVLGIPVSLSGEEGPAAVRSREFAAELAAATGLPVHLIDERLTTRMADAALKDQGVPARARRGAVDKVAATVILQSFLDRVR